MALTPLSHLAGWEVTDRRNDIRGRKIIDNAGRDYGCVRDLIVDTDEHRVRTVCTDSGRELPVEPLEIREGNILLHHSGEPEGWTERSCGCISVRPATPAGGRTSSVCLQTRGKELLGAAVEATDGALGKLHDIYFDDEIWAIRYFVVDTGGWLHGKTVLIPPGALSSWAPGISSLRLSLTKEQIQASPDADSDRPVSRQKEIEFGTHWGWPVAPGPVIPRVDFAPVEPIYPYPRMPLPLADAARTDDSRHDPHLRSMNEIMAYKVEAPDGDAGRVIDFALDLSALRITSLLVATNDRRVEEPAVLAVFEVDEVRWEDRQIRISESAATLADRVRDNKEECQ